MAQDRCSSTCIGLRVHWVRSSYRWDSTYITCLYAPPVAFLISSVFFCGAADGKRPRCWYVCPVIFFNAFLVLIRPQSVEGISRCSRWRIVVVSCEASFIDQTRTKTKDSQTKQNRLIISHWTSLKLESIKEERSRKGDRRNNYWFFVKRSWVQKSHKP